MEDGGQVRSLIRADDSFFTSSKVSKNKTVMPAVFLHFSNPLSLSFLRIVAVKLMSSAVCWLTVSTMREMGLSRRRDIEWQLQPAISINTLIP